MIFDGHKVILDNAEIPTLRNVFMEHHTVDPVAKTETLCNCPTCDVFRKFLATQTLCHLIEAALDAAEQEAQEVESIQRLMNAIFPGSVK